MTGPSVVLDANVLIPAAPRDTLLRAAEGGLYQLHWSDEILEEVERNLVEHSLTSADDARDLIDIMRGFFPEARITGFHELIDAMPVNSKDRHVLAAAVHAHAAIIVTENLRDFKPSTLAPYAIEALSIDGFLMALIDRAPEAMLRIVREQAADLDFPPMTTDELLTVLAAWAPSFVQDIQRRG